MEQFWNALTSGVVPIIVMALATLVPAVTASLITWLKAQAALQELAVKNAIDHVDALRAPAVDIPNAEAKAMVLRMVADQLPRVSEKLEAKLAAKIDATVTEKRAAERASSPPGPAVPDPDDEVTPTGFKHPSAPPPPAEPKA